MLILTRKAGQSITIGNDIRITVLEVNPKAIRIGITAPKDVAIFRDELYEKIQEQNRAAAEAVAGAELSKVSSMILGQKKMSVATMGAVNEEEIIK